jgi:hypothetical protein
VASSTEQMVSKMEALLRKKNAIINSLWFDSHGHYNKGYSLFELAVTNSVTRILMTRETQKCLERLFLIVILQQK